MTKQPPETSRGPHLSISYIVGKLGGKLLPQATEDIAFSPRNRYRLIKSLVKVFWRGWREYFLAILNTRRKWRAAKENLKRGEFVLVVIRMLHVVNVIWVEW